MRPWVLTGPRSGGTPLPKGGQPLTQVAALDQARSYASPAAASGQPANSRRLSNSLWPATLSGASAANSSAQPWAAARSPARWANPRARARSASSSSAARSMDRAVPWPASRARRCTVHWSTIRPSLAAGIPKRAVGSTTRRSQAMASWVPAPSAAPCTAAMIWYGRGADDFEQVTQRRRQRRPVDQGQVGAGAEVRPGPGQHHRPGAACHRRLEFEPQPLTGGHIEGVAPVLAIDGDGDGFGHGVCEIVVGGGLPATSGGHSS